MKKKREKKTINYGTVQKSDDYLVAFLHVYIC